MLVGLIVAIFFILLALSIAAPKVAEALKREREIETMHRGDQYVRAIQVYYRKTHSYPGSMEALEKTNNMRFLRQRYVDPMTGKADWKLIHVGEAKTTVKGFFGQPLAGLAPGLGAASGMASPGSAGLSPGGFGGSSPGAFGGASSGFGGSSPSAFGGASSAGSSGSGFGSTSSGISSNGSSPGTGATGGDAGAAGGAGSAGPGGLGSASGLQSQSATGFSGSGGPFVGVGLPKQGDSITVLNEQTTYQTWEFIYDPRIEQLKAKANLLGGGPASTDAGGLGSASGMNSGVGGTGNSPSGFWSGSGSGFGNSGGFGTTPSNGSGSSGSSGFGSTPQAPQAPQSPQ